MPNLDLPPVLPQCSQPATLMAPRHVQFLPPPTRKLSTLSITGSKGKNLRKLILNN